jgi:signal transduction histidine kinase
VQVTLQGEYVQLAVSDTGIGISPAEIPKIFDSFYRGRSTTGCDDTGAGLGLTLVQQLLLRCGGSISVTSRLGEGSTFKVLLPIASPTAVDSNS